MKGIWMNVRAWIERVRTDAEAKRKTIYYGGVSLIGLGILLFIIPLTFFFFTMASVLQRVDGLVDPFAIVAPGVVGFFCVLIGQVMRARGRKNYLPQQDGPLPAQGMKVRCQNCGELSELSARYCEGCGMSV